MEAESDKIIIILCTSCGSRCNSYMGFIKIFYVQVYRILIIILELQTSRPDIGKRILAVMNDFQICKNCWVVECDTDTDTLLSCSVRDFFDLCCAVQVCAELNLTININM